VTVPDSSDNRDRVRKPQLSNLRQGAKSRIIEYAPGMSVELIFHLEEAMTNMSTDSIVIVGAGFAGISAARYLKRHGHDAIILEARDCIGGRIRTIHDFGVPVDLGAAWLHGGPGNPLKKIAQEIPVAIRVSDYSNLAFCGVQSENGFVDPLKAAENLPAALNEFEKALKPASLWPYCAQLLAEAWGLVARATALQKSWCGLLLT